MFDLPSAPRHGSFAVHGIPVLDLWPGQAEKRKDFPFLSPSPFWGQEISESPHHLMMVHDILLMCWLHSPVRRSVTIASCDSPCGFLPRRCAIPGRSLSAPPYNQRPRYALTPDRSSRSLRASLGPVSAYHRLGHLRGQMCSPMLGCALARRNGIISTLALPPHASCATR